MDYRGMVKGKNKKQRKRGDDHYSKKSNIKVVYISTPMKVKTSASRFRSLVQELTGQESDIIRIMESNGATEFEVLQDHNELELLPSKASSPSLSPSPSSSSLQLPTTSSSTSMSSESFNNMEPNFDDLFSSQIMEEQFLALLANSSNLPHAYSATTSEVDVLGSYDAL